MKLKISIFLTLFFFSLSLSLVSYADNNKSPSKINNKNELFPDGMKLILSMNRISLKQNKKIIWNAVFKNLKNATNISLKIVQIDKDSFAVNIKSDLKRGYYRLILLKKKNSKKLKTIYDDIVIFKGDIGEKTAVDADIIKTGTADGDVKYSIIKGLLIKKKSLCGRKISPLIFTEKYNLKTGRFSKENIRRFFKFDKEIDGVNLKHEENRSSVVSFLIPQFASSVIGDNHNPFMLVAPFAASDKSLVTAWIPDTGKGLGDFITFTTRSTDFFIHSIKISINPEHKKHHIYPDSMVLLLDNKTYLLKFPKEADEVIFKLPEPVKSSCLSLVIDSVKQADKKGQLAIYEVDVSTGLDKKDGLKKLVLMLNSTSKGEKAVLVLRGLGVTAVDAISADWKNLNPAGQKRGAGIIADIAPEKAVNRLASVAVKNSYETIQDIVIGFKKIPDAAANAIVPYLKSKDTVVFNRALNILELLNSSIAYRGIVKECGSKSKKRREKIRNTLIKITSAKNYKLLLTALENLNKKRENKKEYTAAINNAYFDLLYISSNSNIEELKNRSAEYAEDIYKNSDNFEDKYRAVQILCTRADGSVIETVLKAAADSQTEIKQLIFKNIWRFYSTENLNRIKKILIKGFNDSAPQVRIAALSSARKFKDSSLLNEIEKVQKDPWPYVRSLAVENAAVYKTDQSIKIITSALADQSPYVVFAALKAAGSTKESAGLDSAITKLLQDKNRPKSILKEASFAAGLRCINDQATVSALQKLLQTGAEPLASAPDISVAVASAASLGRLGTTQAVNALKEAAKRSNLKTDKAIAKALQNSNVSCKQ